MCVINHAADDFTSAGPESGRSDGANYSSKLPRKGKPHLDLRKIREQKSTFFRAQEGAGFLSRITADRFRVGSVNKIIHHFGLV